MWNVEDNIFLNLPNSSVVLRWGRQDKDLFAWQSSHLVGQHCLPVHLPGSVRLGKLQGATWLGGASRGEEIEGEDPWSCCLALPRMGPALYSVLDDGQGALCAPLLSCSPFLLYAYWGAHRPSP